MAGTDKTTSQQLIDMGGRGGTVRGIVTVMLVFTGCAVILFQGEAWLGLTLIGVAVPAAALQFGRRLMMKGLHRRATRR